MEIRISDARVSSAVRQAEGQAKLEEGSSGRSGTGVESLSRTVQIHESPEFHKSNPPECTDKAKRPLKREVQEPVKSKKPNMQTKTINGGAMSLTCSRRISSAYPRWCNQRLRGCSMVVIEQPTKPLLPSHSPNRLNHCCGRNDQPIA